jgi:transcriptional regulator with XRE-family HTH domain
MAAREQRKRDGIALGQRLRGARVLAGETLETVAAKMTAAGIPVKKQAVGHWETGTSVPDALQIRRLAKIYGTTTDALLWDDSLSMEAVRFAAQYDALTDGQQRAFKAMWLAYFEEARKDHELGDNWSATPKKAITHSGPTKG